MPGPVGAAEAAPEPWEFWQDTAHSPAANMAIDEALLLTAPARGRPLLRVYEWDRLAVSIGYVQSRAAAPTGFAVVRRPTGGGVVYHDHDFTYTVAIPAGHWLAGLDRTLSYDWINRAVLAGLERCRMAPSLAVQDMPHGVDRASMVCFQNPTRYDILLDARKVAGSAQRRTKSGILHQGSIHFGAPLPMPRLAMTTAIRAGFGEILNVDFTAFVPDATLWETAAALERERYATDAWNARRP